MNLLHTVSPYLCNEIVDGRCRLLLIKTRPIKAGKSFINYICCADGPVLYDLSKEDYLDISHRYAITDRKSHKIISSSPPFVNRKIIGQFTCNYIKEFTPAAVSYGGLNYNMCVSDFFSTRLTEQQINDFGKDKILYGLPIEDLIIYDQPKQLTDFSHICRNYKSCVDCSYSINEEGVFGDSSIGCDLRITKPPRHYCYAKENR